MKLPVCPATCQEADGASDVAVYEPELPEAAAATASSGALAADSAATSAVSRCSRTSLSVFSGVLVRHLAALGVVSAQAGSSTRRSRWAQSPP